MLHISGIIHHMIVIYGRLCKIIISPGVFQNIDFFGCYGGKRAKNGPKLQKIVSVMFHISGTIHHMIVIYGSHV